MAFDVNFGILWLLYPINLQIALHLCQNGFSFSILCAALFLLVETISFCPSVLLSLSVILFLLGGYLFVDTLIELVTTLGRAGWDDVSALHWPCTCVAALSVPLMVGWWCVCVCVLVPGSKINFLPELPTADEWGKFSGHYPQDFYLYEIGTILFSTFFSALNCFVVLCIPSIFGFYML